MPVQELENLRQKYPQYNGIDDMTLATKLAGKYPQYGFILDKVKSEDGAFNSFPKNRRDNLNKGISGQDIAQHPFQSIGKTLMQPVEESLTGRSIADKTDASIKKEAGNANFKGMNPYEVKNKLGDIQDAAFKKMVMAEFADQLTTPINYVGGKAVGEAAKGLVKGVQGIGKLAGYESGRIINSLIKPAQKAFNFGKNPGIQVVKEKIVANNMEELGTKIKQSLEDASKNLKERIGLANKTGKTADYSDMLKPIDKAIADAKRLPKTNDALITRLENAKSDLLLNKDLTKLKPEDAVQLKRDIGDVTKWTKEGTDDATANKALKQAYHSVKTTLEKEIPGIKQDNERLANLIDADVATTKRANLEQKSGFADGLFQKGALFDTAVGVARGDVHEVVRGISEYGITKLMSSPAAKTRVAQWLNNLSKSDLVEAVGKIPQLKTLIRMAKQSGQQQKQP